jgi:RNA recognition motif-containing protein
MMTDRWTGLSRGFGFIEMKTDARAEKAIVALNGTDLNGKVLKVHPARPQLHRTMRGKSKE